MELTISRLHPAPTGAPYAARTTAAVLAAALFLAGAPAARAATAISNYWDPGHTGTVPGSGSDGTWDLVTANWLQNQSGTDRAYANGGVAYFQGAAGTVSLNASGVIARDVLFYTAGYVLQDAPGTSYALTVGSGIVAYNTSGTVTVNLPVNMTSNFPGLFPSTGGTLALTGTLTTNGNLGTSTGTLILSGNNALTGIVGEGSGGTLILAGTSTNQPLGGASGVELTQGGTLLYAAGSSNQIPTGVPMRLEGSTFNVNGQSQDRAHALGALTLTSSSALDFGGGVPSGTSVLAFGKSSAAAWSGTLNVYDYRGMPGTGGGADQLFFGTDATGLSVSQLGEISFYSGGAGSTFLGTGIILSNGEVTYTPVPEPATWLAGALLLGVAGSRWRRKQRSRPS